MRDVDPRHVQTIGFILLPGFALLSFASAVEPLRAANQFAGRPLYDVVAYSPGGSPARSSGGALVPAAPLPRQGAGLAIVFVCAGGRPADWDEPSVLACLRTLARDGVRLGGISGGPYLLAAAGLLAGRDFTIHWEHAEALREVFPDLAPRQARFVIDGNRITCGGGIAALDMMHALLAERMGPAFATRVSDWFLHTHVEQPGAPQRASTSQRHGVHHQGLLAILEKMEATTQRPLGRAAMARFAGVSTRHLDRLFAEQLASTFVTEYRKVRLQHARRLLQQSPLTITEIAVASGFSSLGYFSRVYRAQFGRSPSRDRRRDRPVRHARRGGEGDC